MVAGVRATKALGFVASGLVVGLIVGTSVTGLVAIADPAGRGRRRRDARSPAPSPLPARPRSPRPHRSSIRPSRPRPCRPSARPPSSTSGWPTTPVGWPRSWPRPPRRRPTWPGSCARSTPTPPSASASRPQVATWTEAGALSASLATLYLEVGQHRPRGPGGVPAQQRRLRLDQPAHGRPARRAGRDRCRGPAAGRTGPAWSSPRSSCPRRLLGRGRRRVAGQLDVAPRRRAARRRAWPRRPASPPSRRRRSSPACRAPGRRRSVAAR